MNDDYVSKLEKIISQMLTPLRDLPFGVVIQALSGHKVIPFDSADPEDLALLDRLKVVANEAAVNVNKKGIRRPRPNEVGNDIEPFVEDALNKQGFRAHTPVTSSGRRKSTGYPDIEFQDADGQIHYLECKTFNKENVNTTQRSFYLSPSDDFKVTEDAHHFVLSYEIFSDGEDGNNHVYKCAAWKLLSISDLEVDVKYEFNSDNLRLYSKELVLAEGTIR
jgi:hypothetical protein